MKRFHFRFTLIACTMAVTLMILAVYGGVDLVQLNFLVPARFQVQMVDDLVLAFLLIIGGLCLDRVLERAARRAQQEAEIAEHRLRVFKATMRTVQDIVNNYLNTLQILRLEAAKDPLSPRSLELFDRLTDETVAKLRALGDLETVTEKQMAIGIGIDYERPQAFKSGDSGKPPPER